MAHSGYRRHCYRNHLVCYSTPQQCFEKATRFDSENQLLQGKLQLHNASSATDGMAAVQSSGYRYLAFILKHSDAPFHSCAKRAAACCRHLFGQHDFRVNVSIGARYRLSKATLLQRHHVARAA